jgi:hypothetical protein
MNQQPGLEGALRELFATEPTNSAWRNWADNYSRSDNRLLIVYRCPQACRLADVYVVPSGFLLIAWRESPQEMAAALLGTPSHPPMNINDVHPVPPCDHGVQMQRTPQAVWDDALAVLRGAHIQPHDVVIT